MTFVVETYLSRDVAGEPDQTIARTIGVAGQLEAAGEGIHYLRSIFIAEEETCLLVFEARSAEIVRKAAERAGLDPDRIVRAESREPRRGS